MKLAELGDVNDPTSTTPPAGGLNIHIIITFNPPAGGVVYLRVSLSPSCASLTGGYSHLTLSGFWDSDDKVYFMHIFE